MKWEKYKDSFYDEAKYKGLKRKEIEELLLYAKNLHKQRLPILFDVNHFSRLVGYDMHYINGVLRNSFNYYREFKIKKKSGGDRLISEPLPSLKEIQDWILKNILSRCKVSNSAKAYIRKKSILDNAKPHINKSLVLKLDIKDFFPSISLPKVIGLFRKLKYNKNVSNALARLCCNHGSIPQGSPTSPYISNLIMNHFDKRMEGYCKKNKIKYTRYADDMTFSIKGKFNPGSIISFVRMVLQEHDFSLNQNKIRLMKSHTRQSVTNLVVNNKKIQVSKNYRKKIRQEIFFIRKFGLESHIDRAKIIQANYLLHLIGKCNYVLFIDPKNSEFIEYKEYLYRLK